MGWDNSLPPKHQKSSINKNMPLRMLIYIAREYEMLTNGRDLYMPKQE